MKPPFIIIGMHRSGTSLLAKILEEAGIFMGVVKDHNFEAMPFLSLNQQTLWNAGADWLHPRVVPQKSWKYLPAKQLHRQHFKVNSRPGRLLLKLKQPAWGWKDPRSTFTLPMWLHLFPRARVIHVVRPQEEVVQSLQKRNSQKGEVYSSLLEDKEFCRDLWHQYVQTGRSYKKELKSRYCEISYQQLTTAKSGLQELEKFTGKKLQAAQQRFFGLKQ